MAPLSANTCTYRTNRVRTPWQLNDVQQGLLPRPPHLQQDAPLHLGHAGLRAGVIAAAEMNGIGRGRHALEILHEEQSVVGQPTPTGGVFELPQIPTGLPEC